MLIPLIVDRKVEQNSENWFNFFLNTFVVLDPVANVQAMETGMQQILYCRFKRVA